MSGDLEAVDRDDERASPPMKRIKTEQEQDEGTILSIERPDGNIFDTYAQEIASPIAQVGASHVTLPGTVDAGTSTASLSTPAKHGAVAPTYGLSSSNGEALVASEQSTRQLSLSVATTSALPEDRQVSVDFTSAPCDPKELAIWVAEQIRLFASDDASSVMTEVEKRRRSLSHAPGAKAREKADKDLEPEKVAELEKSREIARIRKASWRNSKSEKNKDNDLRCRINKRAKEIYGEAPSNEKNDYLTKEFVKRKDKRNVKESRSSESPFTGFNIPSELGAKLFTAANDEVNREVNAAGILLVNILHIITAADGPPSNQDAAFALKSALEDPEIDTQPFMKALRILSTAPSIMSAIEAPSRASSKAFSRTPSKAPARTASISTNLGSGRTSRASTGVLGPSPRGGGLASGIEGSASLVAQQPKLRGGMIMETNDPSDSDTVLQAINTAIDILKQMAGENPMAHFSPLGKPPATYVTPYETPYKTPYKTPYPNPSPNPSQSTQANGDTLQNSCSPKGIHGPSVLNGAITYKHDDSNDANAASVVKVSRKPPGIEEAQADTLLRFAGVDSFSDDDDEVDEAELHHTSKPQPDTDVQATLQHIYKALENRDANAGKEQAAALRSVMSDMGVTKNTIISREQSQATARLYAHLASRAQGSSRLAGSIPPRLPGGAFIHHPGNVVSQHPGGAFPHAGSLLPHHPGTVLIPHPGGVFSSPHYPGGIFVPHPSGFFPPDLGMQGNGPRTNHKVSSNPGPSPQARPFVPSSMPPPPVPTRIGTARGKTAEEAKKVRDYGFPPLPGSRPGINLLGMKRKLGE